MNAVKRMGVMLAVTGLILSVSAAEVAVIVGERQVLTHAIVNGERVPMWHEGPARVMLSLSRDATCSFHGIDAAGKAIQIGESVEVADEGETVCEGDRVVEVAVDTRAKKEVDGSAGPVTVNLTYSGDSWGGAIGGNAAISVAFEGGAEQPITSGLTGEGTVPWEPKCGGTYAFTHTAGGVTETATFKAVGFLGGEDRPWEVDAGDEATIKAYMKGRYLCFEGEGEVTEFGGDGAPWAGYEQLGYPLAGAVLPRTITLPASVLATMPFSVADGMPVPEPPPGAVTSWDALTNAVATVAVGAEIAVGADITEAGGELVVPAGKAVTIKLYGKTVSCGRVTVGGALTVGDAEDSVGRIVASNGAKVAKGGSVTLLGGPMRGTFTTLSPGLMLIFK